jgi:hypothetical protein
MEKRIAVAGILLAAMFVFASEASRADTAVLGVNGCGSCYGLNYTLTIEGTPSGTTFNVTLNISGTPSGLPSSITRIGSVGPKIGTGITAAPLTSAPGGIGAWTISDLNSGVNSGGCSGSGNGFICNRQLNFDVASLTNGVPVDYSWVWTGVTVNAGSAADLFNSETPLKVEFENNYGNLNGHLLSETAVPEPATMLLLTSGLFGVLGLSRLQRRKR